MSSLDMSLKELGKMNRPAGSARGGRGGRGRGSQPQSMGGAGPIRKQRQNVGGASAYTPYARGAPVQYAPVGLTYAQPTTAGGQWTHDLYQQQAEIQQATAAAPAKKISGDTVHVSNLAPDVTDDDVREIFERIGPVKSCVVNFNSSGKSTGTATVTFARKADAEKAVEDYDEALVDGRAMKLKLIGTVVTPPVVVKKAKAPAPAPQIVQQQLPIFLPQHYGQQPAQLQFASSYQPRSNKPQSARGGRGGRGGASNGHAERGSHNAPAAANNRGRGGKGGRGGRGGGAQKEVTGEDLDAEMDAWQKKREPKAAETPATAGQPVTV